MNPVLFLLWRAAQVLLFINALLYTGVIVIVGVVLAGIAVLFRRKKSC